MKKNILEGKKFGKLTVIRESNKKDKSRNIFWECFCECGNISIVKGAKLVSGHTKSCGCLKIRHNLRKHPLYNTWHHMMSRCYNSNNKSYEDYGGRGIKVCQRWHNMKNFIADVGKKQDEKLTIERINNNKGYSPNNCKWAYMIEQSRNKRVYKKNKVGIHGVDCFDGKFRARIRVNKKLIYLGIFNTIEEAINARKKAELKYWGKTYHERP